MIFPDISSIKQKRKALGLTQNQLSRQTGISQSLIAKLESRKISPSYDIVKRIFEKFEEIEHKKQGTCLSYMSRRLISIKSNDTVKKAAELMNKNSISQVPVFQNSRLVGNISENCVYNKILEYRSKEKLFSKKIVEIMEDPLPTISAQTPINIAMPLLKTNSAILLTEKDKIVGILTKEDFIIKS